MDTLPGSHIGRIRIDAVLGAGGMGTVYRGFDERLERAVALKRIHADKRRSAALRARFMREARVLSKLDHPNICRIYDVIEADDADYLVLELIDGVTLRQRIEALSRGEALRVILQIARVLALAHGHGIVHRDLKPENVMITPAGEVKVLDYGLARLVDRASDGEPIEAIDFDVDDIAKTAILGPDGISTEGDLAQTFSGTLVGTLHYMSPEQARGLPLSAASDMYSLGIMLAEMLSGGVSPYGAFISNVDLLQRVRAADVALPPLEDRDLARLLARLTSLQPPARPTAAETCALLERILAKPAVQRRRLRALGAAAAIAAVVIAGVVAGRTFFAAPSLLGGQRQLRIAVMPIKNETGDRGMQWIEMGLGGVVADAIGRTRGADVIAPEAVVEAMRDIKLTAPESDPAQRRLLLDRLGADVVVTSAARSADGIVTIRYAVAGRESAESAREARSSVPTEAATQMATQLVQRIDPRASARDRYSFDSVANMLFAMGRDAQRQSQAVATHYFTVCLDRDPDFVAARARLAESQHLLGESAEAQRNLDRALAQARARNDREIVATALITRARWRVDAGDYAGSERDAADALAVAMASGSLRLRAQAQNSLAAGAWRQNRLDRAKALFEETLRTFVALRSPRDEAKIYNNLGIVDESRHNIAAARASYLKGLAIAERFNDRLLATTLTGNLANAYGEENDFARAEAMTRRQLALARDVGDKPTETLALLNLGLWTWSQGNDAEGVRWTNEALAAARKLGARPVEALLLSNLATAKTRLGDVAGAVRDGDAALAAIRGVNDPAMTTDVFLGHAYALIRAGRLTEAQRLIDDAERAAPNARCKVIRARLAYARGDYHAAYEMIAAAKQMGESWPLPYEEMLRAFEESSRSGRPSSIAFERGS
jgi:tetratricopeptide (TPR) repeat protein